MIDKQWFLVLRNMPEQQAIFNWWIGLEQRKGERAALRRCDSIAAAMEQVGFHRLQFELRQLGLKVFPEAIASVACVLVHIKIPNSVLETKVEERFEKLMQERKTRLAIEMGAERDGGAKKPVISELRFQRLLQANSQDDDDFLEKLRRIAKHLDKKINPIYLADDIFYRFRALKKPDDYRGEKSFQFKLAKDYYQEIFTYQNDKQGA